MMRATCLAALAMAAPAWAEPGYYRVTGVAPDDVLNIRSAPDAGSADIGDLAPDARGIEVLGFDASRNWARIGRPEGDGWIAERFLARDDVARIGRSSVPIGLACAGTEPFWSLTLDADGAEFAVPAGARTRLDLRNVAVAEDHRGNPVQIRLAAPEASARAVIAGGACSDGMSDRSYGWRLFLDIETGRASRFLSGCCHLPRD